MLKMTLNFYFKVSLTLLFFWLILSLSDDKIIDQFLRFICFILLQFLHWPLRVRLLKNILNVIESFFFIIIINF